MERRAFRAMGTDVQLLLAAPPSAESEAALVAAEAEIERLERLLSRFRGDSELSALNASGRLFAGPDLVAVTRLAVAAREETDGRFDPTVHEALVAAGYDRSFEHLDGAVITRAPPARCGGRIRMEAGSGLIELEPGFRLDLGGIAKGYAVDRACELLAEAGPCLVDAGGDMVASGMGWPVGIETAGATLTLSLEGALATSGIDRRRWRTDAGEAHHLIDPRTGCPAETDLLRVTAVAADAARAEVLAKSLFLAGAERARVEANELGIPAVLVTRSGETVLAGGLA